MGRALRRTFSPQIKGRLICENGGGTSSGVTILQNGGGGGGGTGSVVFAAEKAYEESVHAQRNHGSSLTSLTAGMACPAVFSSAASLSTTAPPHSDKLFSTANSPLIFQLPCLRIFGRAGGSIDRAQKSSGVVFCKRPMLHLLFCLVLGIVMGVTSLSWSDFSSFPKAEVPRDLALANGLVSSFRRDGFRGQGLGRWRSGSSQNSGNTESRAEKLIENDSWRVRFGDGKDSHRTAIEEKKTRALQLEQLKSTTSFELAPGLKYTLDPGRKLLIIVTPTYNRPFQAYYLTRLAHTLRLVPPPVLWLVVEMPSQTLETASVLMQTGIMYRHLVCKTNLTDVRDRFVHQRNLALQHIEMHQLNGVVYFADEDNVYSQDVFEEMRKISRFGTWPVATLGESQGKTLVEGPVCDEERVIGWRRIEDRYSLYRFYASMSGFAFNSTILWDSVNWRHRDGQPIRHLDTVQKRLQVSTFIEQLVEDEDQMQGLPSRCRQIMVWHLHVETPELAYPARWSLVKPLLPNIPFRNQL